MIRIDGASEITVSTISICNPPAISLPSPLDMPILIRLSPSAARTLADTAKIIPIIVLIAMLALAKCFLIYCNILKSA